MNWNQAGMPSAFISRLGQKRELGEFKSVLTDAHNHILQPTGALPSGKLKSQADGLAEWEEWDRRFRALLG